MKLVKSLGLNSKLKNKGNAQGDYLALRQNEFRVDGTKNDPIKIVDANNKPWDSAVEIGNGSVADVKIRVVDFGKGKQKGVYIQGIRVLDLVPYTGGSGFPALTEDDEYFAKDEDDKYAEQNKSGPAKPPVSDDDDLPF